MSSRFRQDIKKGPPLPVAKFARKAKAPAIDESETENTGGGLPFFNPFGSKKVKKAKKVAP